MGPGVGSGFQIDGARGYAHSDLARDRCPEIAKPPRHLFDGFQNSPPSEHHAYEYSDANIAFHTAVIALGGSQTIVDATRDLLLHVRAIRRATITQSDRAARSIIDHLKIIEALERRDTELAERLTRQHTLDLAAHVERYCDFLG